MWGLRREACKQKHVVSIQYNIYPEGGKDGKKGIWHGVERKEGDSVVKRERRNNRARESQNKKRERG